VHLLVKITGIELQCMEWKIQNTTIMFIGVSTEMSAFSEHGTRLHTPDKCSVYHNHLENTKLHLHCSVYHLLANETEKPEDHPSNMQISSSLTIKFIVNMNTKN
jgi:hypothetical protein